MNNPRKMILAKKVRLFSTKEQEEKLWKSAGTARFIFNWTLGKLKDNYANGGKFLSDTDLRKEITKMKQTAKYGWLKDVSNNIVKQAVKDACVAYKNFFKGKGFLSLNQSIRVFQSSIRIRIS